MATEYAECTECGSDGPHTVNEDGTLECGSCYAEFPNPFADDTDQPGGTMSNECKRHHRRNCSICRPDTSSSSSSSDDNAGQVGIDNQGDLTMGIGGGFGIDTSDGSLTIGGGGFSIDTDGE